jgi:hypothetical protein
MYIILFNIKIIFVNHSIQAFLFSRPLRRLPARWPGTEVLPLTVASVSQQWLAYDSPEAGCQRMGRSCPWLPFADRRTRSWDWNSDSVRDEVLGRCNRGLNLDKTTPSLRGAYPGTRGLHQLAFATRSCQGLRIGERVDANQMLGSLGGGVYPAGGSDLVCLSAVCLSLAWATLEP